jgi:hypothetical protein
METQWRINPNKTVVQAAAEHQHQMGAMHRFRK